MAINGINQVRDIQPVNGSQSMEDIYRISFAPAAAQREKGSFEEYYQAALALIHETNQLQQQADKAQLDFATGKDNMLELMLVQQKAFTSLSFTVQVTNKAVEAYREIMRIQL